MTKKREKLIDLHYAWSETGKIPDAGLCLSLQSKKYARYLYFISPEMEDIEQLKLEEKTIVFWGYDKPLRDNESSQTFDEMCYTYTPLRQTLMLLMCAIKGEL